MLVGFLVVGEFDKFEEFASPALPPTLAVAAAAFALAMWLLRESAPTTGDGDLETATRRTRRWTKIAIEAPVLYALTRVLMFLQVPGFSGMFMEMTLVGLGLSVPALAGAWLAWGLVAPWGERFPRWLPGLTGRRVPIGLAVIPALAVAMLIAGGARGYVIGTVAPGEPNMRDELMEAPLIVLPMYLWPLWAAALALAALNYRKRRLLAEARQDPQVGHQMSDN